MLDEKIVYRSEADGKRPSDHAPALARFQDAGTKGKDLTRACEKDTAAFEGPDDGCYHASSEFLAVLSSELKTDSNEQDMPTTGVKLPKKIMFQDMVGIPYEAPKWDEFVSQMTIGEMCNLCGNGAWHTEKIKRAELLKVAKNKETKAVITKNLQRASKNILYAFSKRFSSL